MTSGRRWAWVLVMLGGAAPAVLAGAAGERALRLEDVFELEYASDPQIAPDGRTIVYVRNGFDIMSDRRRGALWMIDVASGQQRPLPHGADAGSPRWSPDGGRLAFVADADGEPQIHVSWLADGATAAVTRLRRAPDDLSWSPDGRWLAFTMLVPREREPFVKLPERPAGAEWAPAAKVIERVHYRADGAGYLEDADRHLFVVPADGGTPRQVTEGAVDHDRGYDWLPDGAGLVVSVNRRDDRDYEFNDSSLFEVSLAGGPPRALTQRYGPDERPRVSPDGRRIAYLGHDDRHLGQQQMRLYVLERDGGEARCLTAAFDHDLASPTWAADGRGVYVLYDEQGVTRLGLVSLDGSVQELLANVGGLSLGRPYGGGSYSVANDGRVAYTLTAPDHPADVAVGGAGAAPRRLTELNADLFAQRDLAPVEELWYESSHDGRRIQGWVARPPGFEAGRRYPLILEIHGGPFANYGPRFAMEVQLYAAAGYVVLYTNPRGSTSYGEEFANLIHHAYPGNDYDDLMAGVDAVIAAGYVDPERLFVTGGSGGGVLTSWIVGKTDRFKAAVVAKPVINWISFALTADIYPFVPRYWFPGMPWEATEEYLRRSPLTYVGNVTTPTMLLTGELDYRTPIAESEQFFHALKLRKVDTVMVRIPGASHGIARRPSHLMAKVAHILEWFERYGGE